MTSNSRDWILLIKDFPSGAPPVFLTSDEILYFLETSGVFLIIILFLGLLMAYGFMFLRRGVKYLKMIENGYIDDDTLDSVELALKTIWGLLTGFACLALFGLFLRGLGHSWFWDVIWMGLSHNPETQMGYIGPIMSCVIVGLVFWLAVKFSHRGLQYQAGNLKIKPKKPINARVALLIELFLKYALIMAGVSFIVVISLTAIGYYDYIVGNLISFLDRNKAGIVFVAFVLVLGYFLIKVFDTFAEDMKKKETKFHPQVMEVAKVAFRYFMFIILGITVLYSLLQMFALQETGMMIVLVIIVLFSIVGAIAATSNLRNAFSGIILMMTRPFGEGDRVKILDGIHCDIISMDLIFTKVRTVKGEIIDIPNNEVLSKPIMNHSRSERHAISITVTVPIETDMDLVKAVLTEAAIGTRYISKKVPPEVYTIGMSHDRTMMELLTYTKKHRDVRNVQSELLHSISKAFRARDIRSTAHIAEHDEVEKLRAAREHEAGPGAPKH